MTPRPPTSTLFPYTTLFRSEKCSCGRARGVAQRNIRRAEICRRRHRHNPFANIDRKSTRLNSSHGYISYAVFCLKKKKPQPAVQPPVDASDKELICAVSALE